MKRKHSRCGPAVAVVAAAWRWREIQPVADSRRDTEKGALLRWGPSQSQCAFLNIWLAPDGRHAGAGPSLGHRVFPFGLEGYGRLPWRPRRGWLELTTSGMFAPFEWDKCLLRTAGGTSRFTALRSSCPPELWAPGARVLLVLATNALTLRCPALKLLGHDLSPQTVLRCHRHGARDRVGGLRQEGAAARAATTTTTGCAGTTTTAATTTTTTTTGTGSEAADGGRDLQPQVAE